MQEAVVTRPVMRGGELQKAVIDYSRALGWKVAHFQSVLATRKDGSASWRTPVSADGKGFPDLLMVKGDQIVAAEIKGDGDRLRPEQEEWLVALQKAGVACFVVTPQEWHDSHSQMMEELTRK